MLQESDLINLRKEVNEIAKIGVYYVDLITGDSYWDPVLKEIFEVPADFKPFKGASDQFFVDPLQLELKNSTYQKSIENGTPFEMENQIVTAKGKHKQVRTFGNPTMKDGKCIGLSGGLIDVTSQKQTEHDLMQIKEQWDLAEDMTNMGYWQWNVKEDLFQCSDNLRNTYGFDLGTEINLDLILSKVHQDDREILSSNLREFLKTKQFRKFTYRICPREGETKTLLAHGKVISNTQGRAIEMVGTTQDITETAQRSLELEQKNRFLSFAEELSSLGHWTIDVNTDGITWSDNLYKLYGFEIGTPITYDNFLKKIHPDDRQLVIDKTAELIKKQKKLQFTHRSVRGDGTIKHLRSIGTAVRGTDGRTVQLIGTTQDVTDLVERELELSETNDYLTFAEELAEFGYFQLNVKTGEAFWSDNTYRIYGKRRNQKASYELFTSSVHKDDLERVNATISQAINAGRFPRFTHRTVPIKGQIKVIEILGKVVKDEYGSTHILKGTVNDITDIIAKELELTRKTQLMDIGEQMANIAYWDWDLKKNSISCSDNLYKILDYPLATPLTFDHIFNRMHPEDREPVSKRMEEYIATGEFKNFQHRILHDSGELITVDLRANAFKDKEGKVVRFIGVTQDITERILQEQALLQKNHLLNFAEEMASLGHWQWFPQTDHFIWSDNLYRIFEIDLGTPMSLERLAGIIHPDDEEKVKEITQEILVSKIFNDFTYRIVTPSKQIKTVAVKGEIYTNRNGEVIEVIGTTQCITLQVERQQKLLNQKQLMDFGESLANIAYWQWDIKEDKVICSDNLYRMHGFELGAPLNFAELNKNIHPEDVEKVQIYIQNSLETGLVEKFEFRIIADDGSFKVLEVDGVVNFNELGEAFQVIGVTQDITERIKQEEEKQRKNQLLVLGESISKMGHWRWFPDTGNFEWSDNIYRLYELEVGIPINTEVFASCLHPDDVPLMHEIIAFCLETKTFKQWNHRTIHKDGSTHIIEVNGEIVLGSNGEVKEIIGTVQDITDRLKNEQILLDKNEQLLNAEKLAKIGNWHWFADSGKVIWSDNLYAIFEHPKEKSLSYETYLHFVHPDDYNFVKEKIDKAIETGVYEDLVYRIQLASGTIKTIKSVASTVQDENGNTIEMMGTCQDVTEQVKKEQELLNKNLQLNFAEEMAGLGYWSWNVKTDDVEWSDNVYRIFEKEMHQKVRFNDAFDRTHPDDVASFQQFIDEVFRSKTFRPYQYRVALEEGIEKHVEIDARLTLDNNGEITQISGTVHDITQRIKDQEEKERRNQLLVLGERISKMGHWRWFPSTNELEWSDNIYRLYNVEIGTPVDIEFMADHIHPEDVSKLYDMMTHCLEQKSFKRWTHRIIHENGFISTIEINGELIFDSHGNIIEVIGTGQDITVRIKKEQELLNKNQQLQFAEQMAKIGYWEWTINEDHVYWSDNLYEIYEREKGAPLTFKTYLSYIHEEDYASVSKKIEDSIKNQKFENFTYRIRTNKDTIKTIKSIGRVVQDKKGKTVQLLGTCQDITTQIERQQELVQKNQMMAFAEELSGIGYWKWDVANDVMEKSENLLRILEFEPNKHLSFKKYLSRVHPKDIEMVIAMSEQIINNKKFEKFTHRIIKTDGSEKTLELTGEVILNQKGKVVELIGSTNDITERIKNEQTLVQNNQLLNIAEKLSGIGHFKWNTLYSKFEISENLYRILGFEMNSPMYLERYLNSVHADDRERVTYTFYEILQTRNFHQFTHRIIRNDGVIRTLEVTGELFEDINGVVEIVGTAQDVTDRRMAEIKFRGLLESAPDAMIITDIGGTIQLINHQAEKLLGYTANELVQQHISIITPEQFNNLRREYAKKFAKNPQKSFVIQNEELFIKHKNGNQIPIQISLGPVVTAEGLLISIAIRDITQQKNDQIKILEANNRLKVSSEKLKFQNRQLSDFNHITSHNLRAPVSNLNSLLTLYKVEKDDQRRAILFEKFEKVIIHLSTTLETLIETLRIKSETPSNAAKISFATMLEKTKDILAGQILNTEAVIEADFSEAPEIIYNEVYLESIFQNLISNAIKYRSPERVPYIQLKTAKKNGKTSLSVSDNGLGIDLKKHGSKLFGLNKVFHRHPEAKGVGLFLTRAQIEALGGSIKAESEVGKGTTFHVNFD